MAKFSDVHDADDHAAIEILGLITAEMDDELVLAPDGAGGVEFRAEAGGGAVLVGDEVVRTAGDVTKTGDTNFSDVTGMSITLTTGARRCLIGAVATGYVSNSAGSSALDVDIDGTRVGNGAFGIASNLQHATASETLNYSFVWMTATALTAASHTFKLQMKVGNAAHTFTLNAQADAPLQFWVAELPF